MQFDIQPLRGALPILFGMTREEVHRIVGKPESSRPIYKQLGTVDVYPGFNIGYDNAGLVNHLGFTSGGIELTIQGTLLWDAKNQNDPNPALLALDPEPVEKAGFWYFTKLGVTTTGYHDDDSGQRAVTVKAADNPELAVLVKGTRADTSRYNTRRTEPKK